MPSEDYAIVLDYMPRGKSSSFKTEPIAQIIGTEFFTLLEVVPRKELKADEKIYIGKDKRDAVEYIKSRITYDKLTSTAISEMDDVLKELIHEKEQKFVEFFNISHPITIKRHQLELLPGLGKKHVVGLLKQREIKPFESFDDLIKRVHLMPDPIKIIEKRIIYELEGIEVKHYLFTRPPAKKSEEGFRRPARQ